MPRNGGTPADTAGSFPYVGTQTLPTSDHTSKSLGQQRVASGSLCPHDMLSTTDIHRWLDGSEFKGERLVVQFARGSNRPRDGPFDQPRMAPRPRRTVHRMTITGLPFETSWQVSYIPSLLLRRCFFAVALDGSILACLPSSFSSFLTGQAERMRCTRHGYG